MREERGGETHLWGELSGAGGLLRLPDQHPEGSVRRLLLPLLLVAGAHRWEPAASQLRLVREPEGRRGRTPDRPFTAGCLDNTTVTADIFIIHFNEDSVL